MPERPATSDVGDLVLHDCFGPGLVAGRLLSESKCASRANPFAKATNRAFHITCKRMSISDPAVKTCSSALTLCLLPIT